MNIADRHWTSVGVAPEHGAAAGGQVMARMSEAQSWRARYGTWRIVQMKTLKAFFWGSLLGGALGWLFAPRHTDLLRAEQEEQRATKDRSMASGTAGMAGLAGVAGVAGVAGAGAIGRSGRRARYIGNAHTKIYHDATDSNLPTEENRRYFGSAAEAEAQGYRPAGRLTGAIP
jgi:hypothetical protein